MRSVVYDLTPPNTPITGISTIVGPLLTPALFDSGRKDIQNIPMYLDLLIALGTSSGGGGLDPIPYNIQAIMEAGDTAAILALGFNNTSPTEFNGIAIAGLNKVPGQNESRILRLNFSYNNTATSNWGPFPIYKVGLSIKKDSGAGNTVFLRRVAALVYYERDYQ